MMDIELKKLDNLLFVVCLLLAALISARVPVDTDMWWHLKAGEITIQTGIPVISDTMSYTKLGEPWINHSWLGQVILYGFYELFGYWGLEAFVVLLTVLCLTFLWKQLTGLPFIKAVILLTGAVLVSLVLTPRPQLFTLFFLALTGWYLDNYLKQDFKKAFWLPILFVLWSNLHAGATLGMIYLAAYGSGYFIHLLIRREVFEYRRNLQYLAGWAFASVLAVAINPNGFRIYGISLLTMQVRVKQYIQEWLPPEFNEPVQLLFLVIFIITSVVVLLRWKNINFKDVAILFIFGYLALSGRRNIAPFAVTVLPILSRNIFFPLKRIQFIAKKKPIKSLNPATSKIINISLVGLLWVAVLGKYFYNGHPVIVNNTIAKDYPVQQIAKIQQSNYSGNLLNEYNWGGYLAWTASEYPVFIDARTDLYGDSIFNDWYSLVFTEDNWQALLQQYDIGIVLLYPDRPLISVLIEQGWKIQFQDPVGILLSR